MYLIAHQDDCQMVTGETEAVGEAIKHMGPDTFAVYPVTLLGRICTCEPRTFRLHSRSANWDGTRYIIESITDTEL